MIEVSRCGGTVLPDRPRPAQRLHRRSRIARNTLGSAAAVREHCIAPARRLDPPILARLATEDLTMDHTNLDTLAGEIVRLSADWTDSVPGDATTLHLIDGRRFEIPLLVDLRPPCGRLCVHGVGLRPSEGERENA
ncbi:hypothetical protein C1I98_17210 [Spongiactinospora gelatinilytica]|uniref:Uncharacterized protein n=1 Tax=Spongiactinospora gelatinilytica TaxID=2666298 RepID=A0A2W2H3D9_9ACTN|nr:hypothetical protein [Spongiactinospora gelatinilytica]PZG44470.1 hypothetical protein C1I98_17210 [Spongiactinospora gelatinilytica]